MTSEAGQGCEVCGVKLTEYIRQAAKIAQLHDELEYAKGEAAYYSTYLSEKLRAGRLEKEITQLQADLEDCRRMAQEQHVRADAAEAELTQLRQERDALIVGIRGLVDGEPYDHERVDIRRLKEAIEGNPTAYWTTREQRLEAELATLRDELANAVAGWDDAEERVRILQADRDGWRATAVLHGAEVQQDHDYMHSHYKPLQDENTRLVELVGEVSEERNRLRAELEVAQGEREQFRRGLGNVKWVAERGGVYLTATARERIVGAVEAALTTVKAEETTPAGIHTPMTPAITPEEAMRDAAVQAERAG